MEGYKDSEERLTVTNARRLPAEKVPLRNEFILKQ